MLNTVPGFCMVTCGYSMLSDSSASECMNFNLWNFKDANEGSSEIQAWQYLGVSLVGVLSTASQLLGKAVSSYKASLEMSRVQRGLH